MSKAKMKQVDSYIYRMTDDGPIYLMLKRNIGKHYEHLWQGVAGKIEDGESAIQTIIRELKEETGKSPVNLFVADHIASFYDARNDYISQVPVFGIEVEGSDVVLSEEHVDYKWVMLEDALGLLTWNGQKNGLKAVHQAVIRDGDYMKWSKVNLK